MQLTELEELFDDDVDSVFIKIKTKSAPVILGSIYKPPHANNRAFVNALEEIVIHPSSNQCSIILTGDININWLRDTPDKTKLTALLAAFDMSQIIYGTTHVGLTHESCIDLIFINNQLRLHGHGIIFNPMHNGITWHNFTYISINISPFRAPRKLIRKRNFHKFNEIDFLAEAGQTLKNLMPLDNESVNGMAINLETKINTLVNNHAPFKQIRVRPTRKPWITNELIKLISHRNRLFKKTRNDANNWTSYKEFRNYVLSRIRQTKKQYYSQIINAGKPGDKWTVLNTLTNKHKTTNNIKEITFNGKTVTDDLDIANSLNDFFSTIGSTINDDLRQNYNPILPNHNANLNGFKFNSITANDVINVLKYMPNNKKGGVAQIPTIIYKTLVPYILKPLTALINKIIYTNTFPNIWKQALVTPLPKSGDPSNPSNHRPISSLPILSKIAEKLITSQMRHYLESNILIAPTQYGFRQNHSAQSLLLQLSNKWLKILDNTSGDRYICLTALDVKKAFDTVDHHLLLSKMPNYFKFHPSAIELMSSYLSSRKQCVKTNGVISNNRSVTSGVPQGSVLGPLLFIMYINDLASKFPCYLFADDCIIEQYGETAVSAVNKTNIIIPEITNWYQNNLLKLNCSKTAVLVISNKPVNKANLAVIKIDGHVATYTDTIKYLGLHLDSALSWNEHITHTKQKILPVIWKFSQIRHLIDKSTARLYYTAFIRPHLEYAAATVFNTSTANINILEKLQNSCLRIISQAQRRTPCNRLRGELHIPSLQNRREYLYLCELYKIYHSIIPTISQPPHSPPNNRYTLRSVTASHIHIPRMNKTVGQRALDYLGPRTYNLLPSEIKTSVTITIFKRKLKNHLLQT